MKRFLAVFSMAVLLSSVAAHAGDGNAGEEKAQARPEEKEPGYYTIVKHDTLWDISKRFMKNPFKWPVIWKLNPYIKNPDLIYPGNVVRITPDGIEVIGRKEAEVEKLPVVSIEEEKAGGEAVVLEPEPEAQPKPEAAVAPKEAAEAAAVKGPGKGVPERRKAVVFAVRRKGFVTDKAMRESAVIVGSKVDKMYLSAGDGVYLKFKDRGDASAGKLYTVYVVDGAVEHPVTKKRLGNIVDNLGVIRITGTGEVMEGVIETSFKEINPGALLKEFKEPYEVAASEAGTTVDGVLVASLENREELSTGDIVYIDRGAKDGLKTGNLLRAYREKIKDEADPIDRKSKLGLPPIELGTMMVIEAGEETSACVVISSLKQMNIGDRVSTIKAK
ncbi:MAG: LysM peptidoglycan-binding domain-containing protein [Deltaproteobacteria bacterium]|nr:LysM peptidoglycan-binding domain-containing protein [Deltaproteobacteria bacterium]